jgi:hypothetical protein
VTPPARPAALSPHELCAAREPPSGAPAAYLQLSEAYADQAARAAPWLAGDAPGEHHLAPLTDPGLVAGSLRELLRQLSRKPIGPGQQMRRMGWAARRRARPANI